MIDIRVAKRFAPIIALTMFACVAPALAAEPDKERQLAAMPTLVDQRNDAMNMVALCGGDLMMAKSEIAKLKSEMEKLKNPPESKEAPK